MQNTHCDHRQRKFFGRNRGLNAYAHCGIAVSKLSQLAFCGKKLIDYARCAKIGLSTRNSNEKSDPKVAFFRGNPQALTRHLHRKFAALPFDVIFFVDVYEVRLVIVQLDFVVGGVAGDN